MQKCGRCKLTKLNQNFSPNKSRKSGWDNTCKECKSIYRKSKRGLLVRAYIALQSRIKLQKTYIEKNIQLCISQEEFLKELIESENFELIHKAWVDSNYKPALTPSVDRIDNNKGYEKGNLQIITLANNAIKDKIKGVRCITTAKTYKSVREASRDLDIPSTVISKCCKGKRKTAKGYTFKYI